jgi:ectoine hydroxylase-related dioxygenase (phytanoyl-CoA dioxygenase family)
MVDQSSRRVQIAQLRAHGYVVLRRFVAPAALNRLNDAARVQLDKRENPLELEADLQYPGAPSSRSSVGGGTVRRLLDAYARDPVFADSGTAPSVREWMQAYFEEPVLMSRAHHNCLMTKHPRYGSLTNWHRDSRYWAFEQENLVSVWIALGEESDANGGLWLVPGSHRMDFAAERFDQRSSSVQILRGTSSSSRRPARRRSSPVMPYFSIRTPCTRQIRTEPTGSSFPSSSPTTDAVTQPRRERARRQNQKCRCSAKTFLSD